MATHMEIGLKNHGISEETDQLRHVLHNIKYVKFYTLYTFFQIRCNKADN